MIPFLHLTPGEDRTAIDQAIRRVLDRGWFILGPELEAFEAEFAQATRSRHAVGVGNGTDALAIVLRAIGVGAGDEVITSPLSAAYTAMAIVMAGARPVFADIDPVRLTLDPNAAAAAVTSRTAALMPVHLYGQPANMDAFVQLAGRHSLALVEDCCQAHLATCGGRPVGSFGAGGGYSFYPTKNLGALGDAGALTTNDEQVARRARQLRNGGQSERYRHDETGVNSRLDEIQAAILRERLNRLEHATSRRRALAARYRALLEDTDAIAVPPLMDEGHVYHLFPVLAGDREALQQYLRKLGIETLVHYPTPIPRQAAFRTSGLAQCPVADRVCSQVLSLPLYPTLDAAAVETVAQAVRSYKAARLPQ